MRRISFVFLFLVFCCSCYSRDYAQFSRPVEYRPSIFWVWQNEMITKKGITSDLEHFKEFGLDGTLIMLVGMDVRGRHIYTNHHMPNPILSQSPEFFKMWKFAAEESARLGLTISTQLGTGWCHSGGPWVKPEQAVQHLVFTECKVRGNGSQRTLILESQPSKPVPAGPDFSGKEELILPRPGAEHFTGDIAVVAFADKQIVPLSEIIDLSDLRTEDRIEWQAPEGNWIVRRYAIRNALAYTRMAPVSGRGLECDKLDKDAVDAMFAGMVGKYLQNSPELVGTTIKAFEADSWEVGKPEWSALFEKEFKQRRGYDPIPWLVSYKTGKIVESKELTERFLNDMYLTQTDLFADNFFTHLAGKADSLGMDFMTEPYIAPFDPLRMAGRVQVPMCEFWVSTEMMHTVRWASSAANTYGRKVVAAEAFTGRWNDGNWKMDPFALKRVGDLAFANGVNKMYFHAAALQPWGTDLKPGTPMFHWGTIFIPGQTWWKPAREWVNYISRCQYMLSQGKNVADIACLMPTLKWRRSTPEGLHKKYNYDLLSEEIILEKLDYADGFFRLPSGAEYRVLLLPHTHGRMSPEVIARLIELASKGGTIICRDRPSSAPGLTDYPQVDAKVKDLAKKLWGEADGKTVFENKIGKGKLIWMNKHLAGCFRF